MGTILFQEDQRLGKFEVVSPLSSCGLKKSKGSSNTLSNVNLENDHMKGDKVK